MTIKDLHSVEINALLQEKMKEYSQDVQIIITHTIKLSENHTEAAVVEQTQAFIKNYIKQKEGNHK